MSRVTRRVVARSRLWVRLMMEVGWAGKVGNNLACVITIQSGPPGPSGDIKLHPYAQTLLDSPEFSLVPIPVPCRYCSCAAVRVLAATAAPFLVPLTCPIPRSNTHYYAAFGKAELHCEPTSLGLGNLVLTSTSIPTPREITCPDDIELTCLAFTSPLILSSCQYYVGTSLES